MIFFAHSWGIYIQQNYAIEALGAMGVQIFFAISGYLIACRHGDKVFGNVWRDGISYAWQKIKKFYPLHVITFGFFFLDSLHNNAAISKFEVILNLTLTKAWHHVFFSDFNGVSWFLSAILFIYLLVPATVNFCAKLKTPQLLTLLGAIFFIRIISESMGYREFFCGAAEKYFYLYPNPIYRYTDFLFGFIVARILNGKNFESFLPTSAMQIFLLSIYVIGCIFFNAYTQYCWFPSIFLILAVLFIYFISRRGIMDYLLGNWLPVYLGNISFELFLLHFPIILLLPKYINLEMHGLTNLFILLFVTIISATIFHKVQLKLNF